MHCKYLYIVVLWHYMRYFRKWGIMMAIREKVSVSFRISPAAKRQVEQLTQALGLSQTAVLETAIRHLAREENVTEAPMLSPSALMRLPLKERRAALAAGAKLAAPFYNADLAKSPMDRELTAFTALDGEPFLELDDYLPEDASADQS
jgi:hypothetical protein